MAAHERPFLAGHMPAEPHLVETLHGLLLSSCVGKAKGLWLNEFGAGVGAYGHALHVRDRRVRYQGYDGSGNVAMVTSGFVKWFDMTLPLDVPKAEWAMCLEAGEHIPHTYEHIVLRNLHTHNCRGIVLSWAVPRQPGHGHINMHTNAFLVATLLELGYYHNATATVEMRRDRHMRAKWFRKSIMVFERYQRSDAAGCG